MTERDAMANDQGLLDSCTLVARPHLFDSRSTVYAETRAGQTLLQMLGEQASHACEVTVGGQPVPRALWSKVRPKAGQTIHVTVWPQGGGGGGNKVLRTVLLVVVAVLSAYTGGAVGAAYGSAYGAAAGAAVAVVGSLVVNALVPPPMPKGADGSNGGDPFQQLNSITGTSNRANPYGVVPCVVGQTRFFPPHAALPYTEICGEDQYLRMLLDLGYGDLDVSDIRIGETDIATYEDVEWEISATPSLFMQDVYELVVGASMVNVNDTATRTTQGASTEISLDIVFGQGLFGVNDKGNTTPGTVAFAVQYRAVGTSVWTDIGTATGLTFSGGLASTGGATLSVTGSKRKTLRCGVRWTVPSGQYEVVVTRGNSSFNDASATGKIGDAQWTVLRSISPQSPSTTGTSKLAVRIKATDQLNGVVQNLSVLAAQRVRRWDAVNNVWLDPVASTNPAWMYLWLCTQCPAVIRRLDDTRMDLYGIAEWAADCDTRGLAIGFTMDSARALGDWLRDVLAAGRASFGLRNGQYSAVRDVLQTVPVQMFTPANSSNFQFTRLFTLPPHALRVKFTNPEANYQQDVRTVYADGYDASNATRFEELDLSMMVDPGAVWKLARYHLSVAWNRPNTYTWTADVEHLVCEQGDMVTVAHDVISFGLAWGRITAIDNASVTLTEEVTLAAGTTYAAQARLQDGTQVTSNVSAPVGVPTRTLALAAPLTGAAVGDLIVLGESTRMTADLVVKTVEPGDEFSAIITAVDAAPIVHTADTGDPPPFVSDITGQAWCAPPDPPVVHIRAGDSAANDAGVVDAQTGVGSQPSGGIYRFPVISGGYGSGGCVVVESYLGDMRRAGDVRVGDMLDMADPVTLAPRNDRVTYSEPTLQPCVELVTESGIVLRCSTTAPLPTRDHGLVLAPHVAGKRVAVRDGHGERWEEVRRLRSIGLRLVQHISVNDGCFWAGAEPGRCVLHHNKLAPLQGASSDARMQTEAA